MPRNMSFSMTVSQFRNRTKTVTRRLGWKWLQVGDVVWGCEKCMGLKKGEKVIKIGLIKICNIRRERLDLISKEDVIKEGFSNMTPEEFISMFCKVYNCKVGTLVTRIEFEYL